MRRFLKNYEKKTGFSGIVCVQAQGKMLLWENVGLACRECGTPFEENSMFSFYSLSKPFCAIGAMKLWDRGLLDLDAHPSRYLPEAAVLDGRVTVRQLFYHTSGLPDFEQDTDIAYCGDEAIGEQLAALAEYPMRFAPGEGARYANVHYILLAMIIERVSGIPYEEYMTKEVFAPLGMKTARIDGAGVQIPRRVQGYAMEDGSIVPVDRATAFMRGAGDIVGTVADAFCLGDAIRRGSLLSDAAWNEIFTSCPHNGMGMGCTLSLWHGHRRITHNGGHTGFRTLHIQLPDEDFEIVILSNAGWGDARNEISEEIYHHFYGECGDDDDRVAMDVGYAK